MPGSANVTFAKDATTVTVPGPPEQTDVSVSPRFVTDQSANHTRWSYMLTGSKLRQWSIPLVGINGTLKAALQTFFDDVVKGPLLPFNYTHTSGQTLSVRFIDTDLKWTRENGEFWNLTIRLESTSEIQ